MSIYENGDAPYIAHGHNAAYDDEYTAPGHVMPLALVSGGVFGGGGVCEHAFELQSMRNTIESLRAEVDNLRAERDAARSLLELAEDGD